MNLENLIEIMNMLGGELRPVSQWPLSVYNYQALEKQAASLSSDQKAMMADETDLFPELEYLDRFLSEVDTYGKLNSLFFYSYEGYS